MEFTTCLGLHSQATRLLGKDPMHGLAARLVYGPDTLCGLLAPFMETWTEAGQALALLPNTTFLGTRFTKREVRC